MDRSLDYFIIIAYLVGVAVFGMFSGGKQKSVKDYFLGSDSVSWVAVCFSIVAAETSTLTFISIPGLAYLTNLNFLQVTFGYLIGRIIVAKFFLPAYFDGELSTAYSFLEKRFGSRTRSFASIVFLFTRTAADGVRLFATAIPLKLLLGIDYFSAIIIIALIALAYTVVGGVKAVIWVDVIQMFLYIGGAIVSIVLLTQLSGENLISLASGPALAEKMKIFNWGFDLSFKEFFETPYTFFAGIVGGAFLSMASHGTDQLVVQRLLATKELKKAQSAIIYSGILVIFQFAVFLFLGVLLFSYYGGVDISSLSVTRADEIFPKFIIEDLPVGISGLIIAGLFAAALSTLAGSISSLSSSTMLDLYQRNRNVNPITALKTSRLFTLMWTVFLIGSALFFMNSPKTVVELALSIASFTYGGLLGTFLLGLIDKKISENNAIIGFICGILIMIIVILLTDIGWTWFTLIGVVVTFLSAKLSYFIKPDSL